MQPPATVPTGPVAEGPTEVIVEGDWDDAEAAVRTAVRREQMAIESTQAFRVAGALEPTSFVFTLRTVRGDSGEFRVRRLEQGMIEAVCRIGAMGSRDAERRLLDSFQERLAKLRGVDYAPLSD